MAKTTVTISKETRESLASLGKKDDSFDQIILKLIQVWEENHDS